MGVALVVLAAVVCTLATGVEDVSSAHLVVQLAEDTAVDTNLIQIGESKIQSKKQVDAAVKKHGSPEQASKGAKAMKEMHDRMKTLEEKLDQVHSAVGANKKQEEKPKSKKVEKAKKEAEKARENAKDCEKKAKKAEKKAAKAITKSVIAKEKAVSKKADASEKKAEKKEEKKEEKKKEAKKEAKEEKKEKAKSAEKKEVKKEAKA